MNLINNSTKKFETPFWRSENKRCFNLASDLPWFCQIDIVEINPRLIS